MNLSPKKEFQRTPFAKLHAELVLSEGFTAAVNAALNQMVMDEGVTPDPVVAAASFHRICGARAFAHTLLNLSEPPPETKVEPRTNIWPKR